MSVPDTFFKHFKSRNYSIKKVKCFNFLCIHYNIFKKSYFLKVLKSVPEAPINIFYMTNILVSFFSFYITGVYSTVTPLVS